MTEMIPLKRIARLVYGDALASEIREEGEVPVIGSGGPSGFHAVANTSGPTIIVGRKGSYGSIYWENRDCFVIDTAYSVRPVDIDTDMRWLYYALQAVDLKGTSQDVGVPGLSREAANAVQVPVTTSDDQRRIADFLDAETAKIDLLASLRSKQAAWFDEAEASWRTELFRQSKSGILTRVKYLLRAKPRYGVLVPEFVDEGIPFIRVNNLPGLTSREDLARIPEKLSAQYSRTVTVLGDVLASVVGSLGKTVVIREDLIGANTARAVAVLRLKEKYSPSLFAAWIGTPEFAKQALLATGADSAQPTLGMEDLANFSVRWPSDDVEQMEMAEAADEHRMRTDDAHSVIKHQLAVLAERRQALITAAVTGQIDVWTAGSVAV